MDVNLNLDDSMLAEASSSFKLRLRESWCSLTAGAVAIM